MHNNFGRVLALSKRCRVSLNLQVLTPLYRGVKETLRDCQHIKESLLEQNVFNNTTLIFYDNKVLKMSIGYASICSSVQDHRQKVV